MIIKLANGNLLVPAVVDGPDDAILDATEEIEPGHPDYASLESGWLRLVEVLGAERYLHYARRSAPRSTLAVPGEEPNAQQ